MGALQKLVFVLGPTCSGKTRLSVDLALALGGEVINIDSQQVYRGFDVGTAKPTEAEKRGVPHHLFSAVDPGDNFDAASYVRLADEAIAGVVARGRIPVFAGGTLLYVRALTQGLARIPEIPQDIRNSVRIEVAEGGCEKAHKRLESVDPGSA
ncbi:MAG: tRNA (adenosine(37)-N6)-dimethylallyltransferase MiaA, partial [Myxococcota bacterium]